VLGTYDDSELGMRDELVLRLGLSGMRAAEMIRLRVGNLHLTHTPSKIEWIRKASRSRQFVPGTAMLDLLRCYLAAYAAGVGRELRPDDYVICREKPGGGRGHVAWGRQIAQTCSVR